MPLRNAALLLLLLAMLAMSIHAQQLRVPQSERYSLMFRARTNGADVSTYTAMANLWRDMGHIDAAQPYWSAEISELPQPDRALQIAETLLSQSRYADAPDTLLTVYPLFPESIPLNASIGLILAPSDPNRALPYLLRVGFDDRYEDAVLPIIGLIRGVSEVGSAGYSAQVGAVLATDGRWSMAESAYRTAVALDPLFAEAVAQVGYVRAQQGKEALSWINRAVRMAPTSPDVRLAQALALRSAGQPNAALAALTVARLYAPQNAVLLSETARTYEQMGLTNEAALWQAQADALITAP